MSINGPSSHYIQSEKNISDLTSIVVNKANELKLTHDLEKLTALVTLAATSVLKNPTPYLKGEKIISPQQYEKIQVKFEKIRTKVHEQAAKEQLKLESKSKLMNAMLKRLRGLNVDLNNPAAVKSLMTDFYQVMGCVASYRKWEKGDVVQGPHPKLPNYEVAKVITNAKGLQIVVLVPFPAPTDKSVPPIFCCRGTTSNPHNLLDDMNAHIGQYSLQESLQEIGSTLHDVSKRFGPVIISGHSLGGAIAQGLAAEFCDHCSPEGNPMIKATYHFNAPGVGKEVAKQYKEKISKLEAGKQPRVYAFRHIGDMVSWAGGSHIPATETNEIGEVSLKRFLVPETYIKTVHCWQKTVSEIGNVRTLKPTRLLKVTRSISERIRLFFSKIFKYFISSRISKARERDEQADIVTDFMHERLNPLKNVKKMSR